MAKIELLPRKSFEISLEDGTKIQGQYGTWALSRFCDKLGTTVEELGKKLSKGFMPNDVIQLVLCAVEYSSRKEKRSFAYTEFDACEWIDELGGLNGDTGLLVAHLLEQGGTDDEKKSQSGGLTSSGTQLVQE